MKIRIIGVDDPLLLKEFAVINQGFFDEWEFVDQEADLEFKCPLEASKSKASKDHKYTCLRLYLNFLEQRFNRHQPWGLLNGMRPNKLVHSMKKHGISDDEIVSEFQKAYLVDGTKINLLLDVSHHQLKIIPDLYHLEKEVSIYIGIPFCPTRCTYCTFAAYAYEPHKKWIAPFLNALLAEIKIIGNALKAKKIKVTSVYLGGGTPTMLDVDALALVMTAVYAHLTPRNSVREMTVEAGRPDTLTREKLELLKAFGVNRMSINPQSFNQKTLDRIGRHHGVDDVIEKFETAKEVGIENVNMDLIVGLPCEGKEALAHSLAWVEKLQPESLTIHLLAFKRKSEISHERSLYPVVAQNVLKEMAEMTYEFTRKEGYLPYYLYRQKNMAGNLENIGYAKAGHESLYNILMMEEAQNVLGLGVGASSKFLIGTSVHNPRDLYTFTQHYEAYAKKKLELLERSMEMGVKSFTYNPNCGK